ncbi:MAG: hypothetical protein ACC628_19320 [Pirellulaceae bacterium]
MSRFPLFLVCLAVLAFGLGLNGCGSEPDTDQSAAPAGDDSEGGDHDAAHEHDAGEHDAGDHEEAAHEHEPGEHAEGHEHEEAAGHSHEKAAIHGGNVTMSKEFHFETVFHSDEVHVYVYNGAQDPIDPKGVTGSIRIEWRDSARPAATASFKYVPGSSGEVGHLQTSVDLSGVAAGQAKAAVDLTSLPGKAEKELSYKETVRLSGEGDHEHEHK